jgi:asparagine synthase (glutamine-hydrolysing)
MCGIAGIVNLDGGPVDCADIKRMTDAIAHRGPDGEGQWCEGSVGLGHRRLAIIDLSEVASQPMVSLDGRYVITYNGEVYNFRELRRELEKSGSRFRSQSDTEVVLEAVIRWGIDSAIKRFNGMFAFAIWDREAKTLQFGRDRYGVKPLYIWTTPGQVAFASEPKAFRALQAFAPTLDVQGVAEYFTFQNILTDRTFLRDVRVFPAGHWGRLAIDVDPCELQRVQYWDFDFREPEHAAPDREYVEEFRRLLTQAVERQLVSDVEVGAYLSGGLDSGSIVAIAAQQLPSMKTFTIGFEMDTVAAHERHFDERAAAESVAAAVGTTQIEMLLGPRHLKACLPQLAYYMEEPRVGQSYPNYYAAQLASGFVKVVLSGTGGDEVLGGYPWRYPASQMTDEEFLEWHFTRWNRLLSSEELEGLLGSMWLESKHLDLRTLHLDVMGYRSPARSADQLERSLYFEAKTFLPGLLAVEDRLSMAHGVEARVPLLDNDLVDFGECLPRAVRLEGPCPPEGVGNRYSGHRGGKSLLRHAAVGLLPPPVLRAPKQGFSGPDSRWLAEDLAPEVASAARRLAHALASPVVQEALDSRSGRVTSEFRAMAWSVLAVDQFHTIFPSKVS